jgi:uncharacterized protein
MNAGFVGRSAELTGLNRRLDQVKRSGRGLLISVRGRRQVGKSRLLSEFAARTVTPSAYFTASRSPSKQIDLDRFTEAMSRSTLPDANLFSGVRLDNWEAALRLLSAATQGTPSIVVIDEFPWLLDNDSGLDGALQVLWDQLLESQPLLLILVGSDLAMMERLTDHDRPLFGRAREEIINPLSPADTAAMLDLSPADAFDAYLVTGGFPRLLVAWESGDLTNFLEQQLSHPTSDLIVVGQRILSAEFPSEVQATSVLRAIGWGERSFRGLKTTLQLEASALSRSLRLLETGKRVVAREVPVSAKPSREARYRVADPYMRFWLRFVEPAVPDIERGRADIALERVRTSWTDYRGLAIEPIVRSALTRLAASDERLGKATTVGGWWPRNNNPQVDLVGIESRRDYGRVRFVGSIKWREQASFDERDFARLVEDRSAVPGATDASLVAVSRAGVRPMPGLAAAFDASDLMDAWRSSTNL